MRIRRILNENPGIAIAAAAIFLLSAAGVIWWQAKGTVQPSPLLPAQLYFSDDDGNTWFADDAAKVPPFVDAREKKRSARLFTAAPTERSSWVTWKRTTLRKNRSFWTLSIKARILPPLPFERRRHRSPAG